VDKATIVPNAVKELLFSLQDGSHTSERSLREIMLAEKGHFAFGQALKLGQSGSEVRAGVEAVVEGR
jgi:hypothetical protein